ncbi:hypothetical protein ScPMuIL_009544 [Solemya velum]
MVVIFYGLLVCNPTACKCGVPVVTAVPHARILFGAYAVLGEHPWQGSLSIYDEFMCGCSLIDRDWVVTAAHCVTDSYGIESASALTVSFGYTDRTSGVYQPHKADYSVNKVYVHCEYAYDNYYDNNLDGDIALLHLSSSVEMNDYILPVCLASELNRDHDFCYVTGWGNDYEAMSQYHLMEKRANIIDYESCNKSFIENDWAPIQKSHCQRLLCVSLIENRVVLHVMFIRAQFKGTGSEQDL